MSTLIVNLSSIINRNKNAKVVVETFEKRIFSTVSDTFTREVFVLEVTANEMGGITLSRQIDDPREEESLNLILFLQRSEVPYRVV